jgi:hypothetical protein
MVNTSGLVLEKAKLKYQNKYGACTFKDERLEEIDSKIEALFKEQETIEEIQSLQLWFYNALSGIIAEATIRKALEMRKNERNFI